MKNVKTHSAFRNGAQAIARPDDSLHDPAPRAVVTTETDTGKRFVNLCLSDCDVGGWIAPGYANPSGVSIYGPKQ